MIKGFILLCLASAVRSLFTAISMSKQLYIPGQLFSLLNISQSLSRINSEYNVNTSLSLTQTATGLQGNSVFDFFQLPYDQYAAQVPCYTDGVAYLNNLYAQFQPCQGYSWCDLRGCNFQPEIELTGSTNLSIQLATTMEKSNLFNMDQTLIFDNTFYPCTGGVYQSEVYLYESIDLTIESNTSYFLMLRISNSFFM